MFVNSNSTSGVNNLTNKLQFASNPAKKEENTDKQAGYAPVTASLWGAGGGAFAASFLAASNQDKMSVDFGAARPTNNPKDFPAIEADTQSGFKLSSLDMPMICPDCGKPIMTKPIFAGIKAELDAADEKTYLDVVEKHGEFLLPQEQKIIGRIRELQTEHPEMTIREVVEKERNNRLDNLETAQYKVLDKIEEVGEVLQYEDRSKVHGLAFLSSNIIFERQNTYAFQRSKFIELVEKLNLKDAKAKEQIRELAEQLPSAMENEDAWYVKYGGLDKKKQPYSSRDIAEKLLAPAYTNTDHVHPWNRGGYDAVSNFWLMHARCNIIKTDKPFTEWLNEDRDNRVEYIGQYLRDSQKAIDESDDPKMHPKYDLYAAKMAKTIYYETNGEVDFTKEFPLPDGYDVPRPEHNNKKSA
ncbi:MAG: HNH endonuclease [Candidatus Gastranaerophilales bacterium]|nr:HNH endonuclease [Candidatus Gastranaerophilales bacterium]